MAEDFFKKMQEDWKKNTQKMQADFNKFFGIKPKSEKNEVGTSNHDSMANSSPESMTPENSHQGASITPGTNQNTVIEGWNKMAAETQNTFKNWQQQWDANFALTQEKIKRTNSKTKAQFEENNQKMKQFFEQQQTQMADYFKKIDSEIHAKNQQNQEKFIQNITNMSQGWSNFVHSQQKKFEKSLETMNKAAWKAQMNFVLWLIPVLILVIVIFTLLKPFFSLIPY